MILKISFSLFILSLYCNLLYCNNVNDIFVSELTMNYEVQAYCERVALSAVERRYKRTDYSSSNSSSSRFRVWPGCHAEWLGPLSMLTTIILAAVVAGARCTRCDGGVRAV